MRDTKILITKSIIFVVVCLGFAFGVIWCSEQSQDNWRQEKAIVIDISDGDTGGLIAPDRWTIKVQLEDGSIIYGTIYTPVVMGQTVYVKFWEEDGITYHGTAFGIYRTKRIFN